MNTFQKIVRLHAFVSSNAQSGIPHVLVRPKRRSGTPEPVALQSHAVPGGRMHDKPKNNGVLSQE